MGISRLVRRHIFIEVTNKSVSDIPSLHCQTTPVLSPVVMVFSEAFLTISRKTLLRQGAFLNILQTFLSRIMQLLACQNVWTSLSGWYMHIPLWLWVYIIRVLILCVAQCRPRAFLVLKTKDPAFASCCLSIRLVILVSSRRVSHNNDVIMSAMASQITSLTIVYSIVYSGHKSKKTSKLCVTGLCAGNSPVIGEFPAQWAINAENIFTWWRHHVHRSR